MSSRRSVGSDCALARSLEVLGDRWTLLILREAFGGTKRFEGFRERLGIARNILSGRLQTLVRSGLLERSLYQQHPDRYEYRLTEKGGDLYDTLGAMLRWGRRWMDEPEGAFSPVVHEKCGQECTPQQICSACGAEIAPTDVSRFLRNSGTLQTREFGA